MVRSRFPRAGATEDQTQRRFPLQSIEEFAEQIKGIAETLFRDSGLADNLIEGDRPLVEGVRVTRRIDRAANVTREEVLKIRGSVFAFAIREAPIPFAGVGRCGSAYVRVCVLHI